MPTAATIDKAQRATACLINARRVAHGLRPLRVVRALNLAAQRHSRDMVRRNYFSHSSRSRWRARGSSLFAENIAWGAGSFGDAQSIVAGWMGSRGHRANILHPGFRTLGVGVAPGVPGRRARGGTYTADFATP
ncbi:MAG: CAP domain-containing protein [Actinomycetota bacterium]|nr:CAP domain-containing protein [Actinomycetota bacterium]